MKTKIEEATELKNIISNNKNVVQKCLGNKLVDGIYVSDNMNDNHNFCFFASDKTYYNAMTIYLDAYYCYNNNNSVVRFNDEFYVECLAKAINKHIPELIEETEKIMTEIYNKALLEAKKEAEDIIAEVKELGLE